MMMENHSFDNLLGWLPGVGDLDGTEYNLLDPTDPNSQHVMVGKQASYCTYPDPNHSFSGTGVQDFAPNPAPVSGGLDKATMGGFVASYVKDGSKQPSDIMQCYTPDQVPVLSALATNFRACSAYHASVPGPTGPNRMFMHAATSTGYNGGVYDGYPINATTIYEHLNSSGYSWAIHFHDFTTAHGIYPLNTYTDGFVQDDKFEQFFDDIDHGRLNNYTFLVPLLSPYVFNGTLDAAVNTQHPFTDIRLGESLIKRVYEKIRSSSYWNEILLIINYDEHGGFWDKAKPVATVNPTPQLPSHPSPFGFDRLGVRVPAILISPWLATAVDDTVYDHTSVLATIKNVFELPSFLAARDAQANAMDRGILPQPRTDCPVTLPPVPVNPPICLLTPENGGPNDLALEYMHMYDSMLRAAGRSIGMAVDAVSNDFEAGIFLRTAIKELFGPGKRPDPLPDPLPDSFIRQ